MPKPKLLYYRMLEFHPKAIDLLETHFQVTVKQDPSQDDDDSLREVDVLLAPLGFACDRRKIDRCRSLKIVASNTLSAPHIDIAYCRQKGIRVCHLADQKELLARVTPTGELTWALIIALSRRLPWAHDAVCRGQWNGRHFGSQTPRMLSQMSLGIVGLGRLGRMVAAFGEPLVKHIYTFSPHSTDGRYTACPSLIDLARHADIVSIHASHTPATTNLIDERFLTALKPGSFLVNTARGALVDEQALLAALESGHLAGAALDVLAGEYEPHFRQTLADHPLVVYARSHDNLIITPHYAGATVDAWLATQTRTVELILGALGEAHGG